MKQDVSVIIPAKDAADSIGQVLSGLQEHLPEAEIIVVNDGSQDSTASVAEELGARVVSHPYSMGNGAAIKTGARTASGDILVTMDADGQHLPETVPDLLDELHSGYDMVVAARDSKAQSSAGRRLANRFYNWLASTIVGHRVEDLTSGFRAVKRIKFLEFLHLLPNGFSYPTTITMAFFRAGYSVNYHRAKILPNSGKSHIRVLHDGLRFVLIIVKVGTLYSPLKFFVPLSSALFATGLGYYLFTYLVDQRFTNMSMLLFSVSVITFLIGLVSEQITTLMYAQVDSHQKKDRE